MTRPARPAPNYHLPQEYPMQYSQDALFPIEAVQTDGWAQPEASDEATDDDTMAEAA